MTKLFLSLVLALALFTGCASMLTGLPSLDMAENVATAPCPDGRTMYKAVFPEKKGELIIAFGFMNSKGLPYHPSAYLYYKAEGGPPIRAKVDGKDMSVEELLTKYQGPCDLPTMRTA